MAKRKKSSKKAAKPKKKAVIKRKRTPAGRKPSKGSKRPKAVKKRAVKLKPVKRTITRKKDKKGRFYYHNKRTGRRASKKSWKGLNTRIRTRKEEIAIREKRARARARKKKVTKKPRKKKVVKKKPTRFNRLQKIFKKYLDTAGIKVGRRFNEYVGNIYRETLKVSLKEIKRHAAELWDKYSGFAAPPPPPPRKIFPESFPFYNARDEFNKEVFDDVKITVVIHDPDNAFDATFEGTSEQFSEWYSFSGALAHLRKYYNESPPAFFVLTDTDGKTFTRYEVELGVPLGEFPAPPTEPPVEKPPVTPPVPPAPEPDKEREIRLLEERRKMMERELELIKKWEELGLSKEEIKERLKKFREGGEV